MSDETIGYKPPEIAKPVGSVKAEMPQIRERKEKITLSRLNGFDQRFAHMPDELVNSIAEKMATRNQDALFGTNL
ncbi:MAG: hypothetical protein US68_C0017G0009 [Candidatus Shapirobacteria bacterium GW2011_GWE1_38_10]|uniref:Uncharacterized protein n=1 Tax=Candidatus Shapirobacteria bacterium GW2011_GWE1_38_10 TaxID=1618488 RepID=A0A0G0I1P2_9BACT|nr:MAG: hypothetical protein US46_C0004G0096 [Candidatus Shapirobacteria bacterium GW2011_GWF2_37_20]KKQ49228.1 MAG: hypothetical protein US68_C0017G0009 [Candidatus Shapirobacteria bacterium GW2011_GWE1_38_10]KKQ62874.1 MAG: hypothetical protein US85_C0021G0003 [Candidatus Shapirobacteria bacterium GW2011_GWF1_38_23]HBP50792.1 hypothetical protein [Candidatus Shapirobacteria bacterium]